jgi:hypothetical protein
MKEKEEKYFNAHFAIMETAVQNWLFHKKTKLVMMLPTDFNNFTLKQLKRINKEFENCVPLPYGEHDLLEIRNKADQILNK